MQCCRRRSVSYRLFYGMAEWPNENLFLSHGPEESINSTVPLTISHITIHVRSTYVMNEHDYMWLVAGTSRQAAVRFQDYFVFIKQQ